MYTVIGDAVGSNDGLDVGFVGIFVGSADGLGVGSNDGIAVGLSVGPTVGSRVGLNVVVIVVVPGVFTEGDSVSFDAGG